MIEPGDSRVVISLVVATVGRAQELERMLATVAQQSFQQVEVIVVDQNGDDRLTALLHRWQPFIRCIHARSLKGLSLARNVGIALASGSIIGFPDDDCWYPVDLLLQVNDWFASHPAYDFFCCAAQDESGREVASRWPRHPVAVDRNSVLRACASASLFMRKAALDAIGGFDETLGLGAATPFQSAEDSDLALRFIAYGCKGWFEKKMHVHHEYKGAGGASATRAFAYGMGFGCLLRRHGYSAPTLLYHVCRPLGGLAKSLLLAEPAKAIFYWNSALGRLKGYVTPGAMPPGANGL